MKSLFTLLTQQFSNNVQGRRNQGVGGVNPPPPPLQILAGIEKKPHGLLFTCPLRFLATCPSNFLDLPRALSILQLVHHPIIYLLVDKLIII